MTERRIPEVNMTSMREQDKPWKTDLARKSAQRREQVLHEVEEVIKKAPSFEESLRQAVELMKKRFARYSALTAYVADGEDLAVQISLDRPVGPERVGTSGGPLGEAAQGSNPMLFSDLTAAPAWAGVGLTTGSAMVPPGRTEAGPAAILEVWGGFREALSTPDTKLHGRC